MNVVTPVPLAVPFASTNINTESARRDNQLRDTIPQPSGTENSSAEGGVGSEQDQVRRGGQGPTPLVYERPTLQQNAQITQTPIEGQAEPIADNGAESDNAEQESAGRENADTRQQEQAEQQEIQELRARDREVRAHEQAHAAVGGQYAGAPQYEFETGPDGLRYAVGGEVSIDISEEESPEDTLQKAQQVRAAALAPAEPSAQDLRVAAEAQRLATEARLEINQERAAELRETQGSEGQAANGVAEQTPDPEEIIQGIQVTPPTRTLDEIDPAGGEGISSIQTRSLEDRDERINSRALRIADFYQGISQPRALGLNQVA